MKTRILLLILSFPLMLSALPQNSAAAACYDVKTKAQIPCPNTGPSKSDYSQRTKVPNPPTKTPTPKPTEAPPTGTVQPIPECTSNLIPRPGIQNKVPAPSPWSAYTPWALGGGGLALGLFIGLFARSRINNYKYPELHSRSHDESQESITVRSEKHTIE